MADTKESGTTPAPAPAVAHKSPALAPIKVLAPLASLPAATTNTNTLADSKDTDEPAGAGDSKFSSSSSSSSSLPPPPMFLDSDEPDVVARAKGEHLLHQRWTFWYDLKDSKATAANWGLTLKKLMEFESIEQFFGMYNNIVKPSQLPVGSDYHLFKWGSKPEWEDPENRNGGKWVWELRKTDDPAEMDKAWLHTMLGIIGEGFSEEREVVGAVISLRKQRNRIQLWTRTDTQKSAMKVGMEWKKMLALSQTTKLGFQSHSQAMKSQRGHEITNQYTV